HRQVLQLMVGGKKRGLPSRALVAIAIRKDDENLEIFPGEPLGKRDATTQAQTMAQAAGAEWNGGNRSGTRRVRRQKRAVLIERRQFGFRDAPGKGKRRVQRGSGVSFGKDEQVVARHPVEAELDEDFQATEGRSDMP